jgi:hypothetical protein
MLFTIKQEGQGITKIVLSEAFKKQYADEHYFQRYEGVLSLDLLRSKIDELRSRITEKEGVGGAVVNIKIQTLSFIYYIADKGIKTNQEPSLFNEKIEDSTSLDIAFRVFQNLFGILEQLEELKNKQEIKKRITLIKASLKLSYLGYIAKDVAKSEGYIYSNNLRRMLSISNNLNNLKKLCEKNSNHCDLLTLKANTTLIYQSLSENNLPSPLCITLMTEELRQFENKITELQTILEPTELW